MNRLQIKDGRFYANGMEVSAEVFGKAEDQNVAHFRKWYECGEHRYFTKPQGKGGPTVEHNEYFQRKRTIREVKAMRHG